ncbi:MAG: multiheme c-type cytochrome [Planctomycetaceae bacterium]
MFFRSLCSPEDLRRTLATFPGLLFLFFTCLVVDRTELAASERFPLVREPAAAFYDRDWPTVKHVLLTKCASCHRPGTDRTDLSTYGSLMAAVTSEKKLVVRPGDPDGSPLFRQVAWNVDEDADCEFEDSPAMPVEKTEWLTSGQLAAVYRWIRNGAQVYSPAAHGQKVPVSELDFPSAKVCAGCHARQYREWSRSMHAYAQHSPVFEAFNLTLVERTSGTIGTFCSRCHTPIGTSLGENESVRNVCRSRISMEGVTCIVCHRRSTAHYKNNGRLPIEPGDVTEGCMYGPFESSLSERAADIHRSQRSPYLKTSQFCGECHDVVAPNGVRNEEAFSEWQHSPAAADGITCQQCHMGPIQGRPIPDCERPMGRAATISGIPAEDLPLRHLTDHSFAGPDYSLLPDTEFPNVLDWMYETDYRDPTALTAHQRATLRTLRLDNRTQLRTAQEKRLELLGNAARLHVQHPSQARCGEKISVKVDVESLVAGHNFPTGFTAERQLWVFVEVCDANNRQIFVSGDPDANLDLRDEHSQEVLLGHLHRDRHLLNFQNQFTMLTNRGTERTSVLPVNRHLAPVTILRPASTPVVSFGRAPDFRIAKGSLPPLTTMGQTYPVRLSETCGTFTVTVRLLFRHLPPALLDAIGTPHLKHLLQVVTIDAYSGTILVSPD